MMLCLFVGYRVILLVNHFSIFLGSTETPTLFSSFANLAHEDVHDVENLEVAGGKPGFGYCGVLFTNLAFAFAVSPSSKIPSLGLPHKTLWGSLLR
jgi:hypothetical protein